jgi:hypothetical protein
VRSMELDSWEVVSGFCVHGNECSGSVQGREIFRPAERLLVSQEGLCWMVLVTCDFTFMSSLL